MDSSSVEALPSATSGFETPSRLCKSYLLLCGLSAAIAAMLVVYSQTGAFAWDEGFHLLTSQLIKNGKRPYLDFFFPQAALNAYWNAIWLRLFGDTWRAPHAVAALLSSGAIFLSADYIYIRFPVARWRAFAAALGALFVGLNIAVVQFGATAQAYGTCLFLIVAAYRVVTPSVARRGITLPALSGFLAGAAAGCSLLCAPVAPVMLLWLLIYNRAGKRVVKTIAFVIGGVVAWTPMLLLFASGPQQFLFNVFKYHMYYRTVEWSGAIGHDVFEVMLAWTASGQAMLLGLFAVAGVLFLLFRSGWDRRLRSEFYLAGWVSLGLALHLSNAHPTFARYYLLTAPFLAILAVIGFYFVAERLYIPERPAWPTAVLAFILCAAFASARYTEKGDRTWLDMDKLAAKVIAVTPPGATLLADELTYFETRREAPSGMESDDSHKLNLDPATSALLHVIPTSEVERRLKAGMFNTVETCDDEDEIQKKGIPQLYSHSEKVEECMVYWDFITPGKK